MTIIILSKSVGFFLGMDSINNLLFNDRVKLHLTGNYATAEIYVNDEKKGVIALQENIVLSGLMVGKNKIKICLKSTMRNMYGPHHCKGMQEDWGACPYMFAFFKHWQNGAPNDFIKEYNFAPFGIKKIEVED